MTAAFERIRGKIGELSLDEIRELVRCLLHRQAFLSLDAEIHDVEAVMALIGFIKEKIDLLAPGEKRRVVRYLRDEPALQIAGQTAICAHCWKPVNS